MGKKSPESIGGSIIEVFDDLESHYFSQNWGIRRSGSVFGTVFNLMLGVYGVVT